MAQGPASAFMIKDIYTAILIVGLTRLVGGEFVPASEAMRPPPKSLAYVLQAENLGSSRAETVRRLSTSNRDWIVIDRCFTGGDKGAWTAKEIQEIRAGRPGRAVLAYLSIGEAEDYREYWKREWDADHDGHPDKRAPTWLCGENPEWKGNYKVRYWDDAWQRLILASVDAIAQAGFDGVYLDIVDGFEFFEYEPSTKTWIDDRLNPATGQTYRDDMRMWVGRLAAQARRTSPRFLVVPQNGAQLLEKPSYVATLDAIGVESLFTDGNRPQDSAHTQYVLGLIEHAKAARKPVLLIEYGTKEAIVQRSYEGAVKNGFVLLITDLGLKTLGRDHADH